MRSIMAALLALVIISACALVYVRHQHRVTFVALQELLQQRDQLNIQWGQLLLEQSTFSFHHYVNTTARKRLGMRLPQPEAIITLDAFQADVKTEVGQR